MKKYFLLTLLACVCTHKAAAQSPDLYLPQWLKIDSLFLNHHGTTALKDLDKLRFQAEKDNNIGQQIKILLFQIVKDTQNTEGVVTAIQRLEQAEQKAKSPVKAVLQSLLGELFALYATERINFNDKNKPKTYAKDDLRSLSQEQMFDKALVYYKASLQDETTKKLPVSVLNVLTMPNYTPEDVFRPTVYDFLAHRVIDFNLKRGQWAGRMGYAEDYNPLFEAFFAPTDTFMPYAFDTIKGLSATHKFMPTYTFMLQTFQKLLQFHQKDANKAAFLEVERRRFDIFIGKNFSMPKESIYATNLEALIERYEQDPSVISLVDVLAQHYIKGGQFKNTQYSYQTVKVEHRFYLQKAYALCTRTLAQHPTAYRRELLERHIKHLQERALKIESEAVSLPEKPILFKVAFKNVDTVYCRWVKVSAMDSINRFNSEEFLNANIKQNG